MNTSQVNIRSAQSLQKERLVASLKLAMWGALFFVVWVGIAQAEIKSYQSQLHHTSWEVKSQPLVCELSQDIPNYGPARFVSHAGRNITMEFLLEGRSRPDNVTRIDIRSLAPEWMPGIASKELGTHRVTAHEPIVIKNDKAWQLIGELEQGMFPTFYHNDWLSEKDKVVVALSAVNFNEYYHEFLRCVDGLLPYSFKDIEMTSIYFEFAQSEFTHETRLQLQKISKYLDAMDVNTINRLMVDIQGYTDSKGGTNYNKRLSKRRVTAVKDFLAMTGLSDNQFTLRYHGEKRPFAENHKPSGQAKNRRVIIRLSLIPT
jgi:outer membrane protein OmpA-like peptidoglycan-associated protein